MGPGFDEGMRWVYTTMEVAVDETCMAHYGGTDDPGKCMFAQYVAPFIETPTFALQSVFDAWSLPNILGRTSEWEDDPSMDAVVNVWGRNATAWIKEMLASGHSHGAVWCERIVAVIGLNARCSSGTATSITSFP